MNSDSDQLQPSREHHNYDGSEEDKKISRKKSASLKKERKSRSRSKERNHHHYHDRRSSRRSRSTSRGRREHHEPSWKGADRKSSKIRVGKKIPKVLLILRQSGGNKFEILRKQTDPFRKNVPQPNRCLGIFGLSTSTTEKELMAIFSKYGHVESCTVVMNGQTRRSRGFCFIYFSTVDEATAAKEACNGMEINGCPVRVDFSITQRAHTPTPGVYMGRYRRDGPVRRRRAHEHRPSYRRSPSLPRSRSSRRQYYRDSRSRSRSPPRYHHRR